MEQQLCSSCDQEKTKFMNLPYRVKSDNNNNYKDIIEKYHKLWQSVDWEKSSLIVREFATHYFPGPGILDNETAVISATILTTMMNDGFDGVISPEDTGEGEVWLKFNSRLNELTRGQTIVIPMVQVKTGIPCDAALRAQGYKLITKNMDILTAITFPSPLTTSIRLSMILHDSDWSCEINLPVGTTRYLFPAPLFQAWLSYKYFLISGLPEESILWGSYMNKIDRVGIDLPRTSYEDGVLTIPAYW